MKAIYETWLDLIIIKQFSASGTATRAGEEEQAVAERQKKIGEGEDRCKSTGEVEDETFCEEQAFAQKIAQ